MLAHLPAKEFSKCQSACPASMRGVDLLWRVVRNLKLRESFHRDVATSCAVLSFDSNGDHAAVNKVFDNQMHNLVFTDFTGNTIHKFVAEFFNGH
jgi:hypothetical protein